MKPLRRGVLVALSLAAFLFVSRGRANAQVLDQVPSNAIAVFKVKNLAASNAKIIKMAKALGLDQMAPDFADPLGALTTKMHITQGLDKAGDLAFAFFDPEAAHTKPDKNMLLLIPVTDYQAFLGNLKEVKEEGGVAEGKATDGNDMLYVAHWGQFAAMSPDRTVVATKPLKTMKLAGLAAKEAASKDAVLLANMDALRRVALPKLKSERPKMLAELEKNMGTDAAAKKFMPVVRAIVNVYLDGVESFLTDATSGVISFNLADEGISTTALAEFKPESDWGKTALELKAGTPDGSLLAGLPDRKYYAFGGSASNPKVTERVVTTIIDPIAKELNGAGDVGKQIADALQSLKLVASATQSSASGYVVANGALGQESIFQQVTVIRGDAKKIKEGEAGLFKGLTAFFAAIPQDKNPTKMAFEYKPAAKTIDGVSFDAYDISMKADPNDPRAAQAQQMMAMVYGPNGMGGVMGTVDEKTLVVVQGGSDKLLSEVIAAAKNPADHLSSSPGVKAVAAHLPEKRVLEYYIRVDQVVSSAVRYAAGFGFPIKVRLPPNLPPIGVAAATDGPAYRVDSFIPTQLVESLIAAGIEAYTNMQGGPGGAGGPGGL